MKLTLSMNSKKSLYQNELKSLARKPQDIIAATEVEYSLAHSKTWSGSLRRLFKNTVDLIEYISTVCKEIRKNKISRDVRSYSASWIRKCFSSRDLGFRFLVTTVRFSRQEGPWVSIVIWASRAMNRGMGRGGRSE